MQQHVALARTPLLSHQRQKLHYAIKEWFRGRMKYLEKVYADEINACDSIIAGKQQLYEARPKLGWELYLGDNT